MVVRAGLDEREPASDVEHEQGGWCWLDGSCREAIASFNLCGAVLLPMPVGEYELCHKMTSSRAIACIINVFKSSLLLLLCHRCAANQLGLP